MISARLLPAVKVGDCTISLEGRRAYTYYLDFDCGKSFQGDDLSCPCGGVREAMEALLSFLAACGEGMAYERRSGRKSENSGMFPREIAEWAEQNSDELTSIEMEINENPDCVA